MTHFIVLLIESDPTKQGFSNKPVICGKRYHFTRASMGKVLAKLTGNLWHKRHRHCLWTEAFFGFLVFKRNFVNINFCCSICTEISVMTSHNIKHLFSRQRYKEYVEYYKKRLTASHFHHGDVVKSLKNKLKVKKIWVILT